MRHLHYCERVLRKGLDKSVPFLYQRWLALAFFMAYVLYRIFVYEFMAIFFLWGLYVLYLVVQFYTPSGLPDPDEDTFDAPPPMDEEILFNQFEEYASPAEDRPLLRTIHQFTFWKNLMLTIILSWLGTLSDIFKLPVYWPFLFIYFVWLIGLAILKHVRHMRKYGYSTKDFTGKKVSSHEQNDGILG